MRDAEAVTFAASRLDRAAHLRGDAEAQAALAADPRAAGLALWRGRPLLDPEAMRLAWRPLADPLFADATGPPVFLGVADGAPLYARDIPDWNDGPPPAEGFSAEPVVRHPGLDGLGFGDLRANMAALDAAEAGTAAAAKGILGWHETHRFCARCGAASEPADAGWRRACPACGAAALPAHRPRGHHADPLRQLGAARPLARLAAGHVLAARRLHGARRVRSRPRSAARPSRRPVCRSAASTTCRASPGRSRPA